MRPRDRDEVLQELLDLMARLRQVAPGEFRAFVAKILERSRGDEEKSS